MVQGGQQSKCRSKGRPCQQAYPQFTELLENVQLVISFFNERIDATKADRAFEWSVPKVLEVVKGEPHCEGFAHQNLNPKPKTLLVDQPRDFPGLRQDSSLGRLPKCCSNAAVPKHRHENTRPSSCICITEMWNAGTCRGVVVCARSVV